MIGIFLDTETSGLNPQKHCILEVALKLIDVSTKELKAEFESVISQPKELFERADPSSLEVNGFTWEAVQRGKPSEEVAGAIITLIAKQGIRKNTGIFICQNPSFDRSFFSQLINPDLQEALDWPYHWLDLASMYWAKHLEKTPRPWETGVSKDKISEVYALPPEEKPHRALNGVNHLLSCYEAVVGFPNLEGCKQNVGKV